MSELKDRTRFRSSEIRWMFVLLVTGILLGTLAAYWFRENRELSRIFVTGTVTLFFGALLGGVVSMLIADFDRRRVQRAAQLEFISNVLSDLKAVYDRIDRGRTLIAAHQSAKTYGEQMRDFIDARVKLLSIDRALRFDERGSPLGNVREDVEQMEVYLHSLTAEFEEYYKEISRCQSIYEGRMKKVLDNVSVKDEPDLPVNTPWASIEELERMRDFLSDPDQTGKDASEYRRVFLDHLDIASGKLRKALESELA